jgi:hypothetical protein
MQMICVGLQIKHWKEEMKLEGLRVITGMANGMCCKVGSGQVEISGKSSCGLCRKGVGGTQ